MRFYSEIAGLTSSRQPHVTDGFRNKVSDMVLLA
jgi:hypothetical protein